MPKFMDVEVLIFAEGQRDHLEEFRTEVSVKKKTVSCYIQSEIGQEFFFYVDNDGDVLITADMYLEGTFVAGVLVDPGVTTQCSGAIVSETSLKPFTFAKLELTDDDGTLAESRKLQDSLGLIEIRLYRVTSSKENIPIEESDWGHGIERVHERCKKAGCHRASLGDTTPSHPTEFFDIDFIDDEDEPEPYATFIFRYRPLDLLWAHEIVPLPPSMGSSSKRFTILGPRTKAKGITIRKNRRNHRKPSGRDFATKKPSNHRGSLKSYALKRGQGKELSQKEQLFELKKQLKKLQAKIEKVSQPDADSGDLDLNDPEIKREPSPIRVPPPPEGEHQIVIDLTHA